jgi:ATP-dependent RNA helicase RhlE
MPKQMEEIAGKYLKDPIRVQVAPPGKTADKVTQQIHFVAQAVKADLLVELLDKHRDELALVFSRTKHGAEKILKAVERAGFKAVSIHGNKSQGQRTRALDSFKNEEVKVLIATDVAARGLDIPAVRHVYNYDLPNVAENYVHRIGRTARAGRDGAAIAFCAPDEVGCLKDIEKVIKTEIPVASGRRWEAGQGDAAKPSGRGGARRGGGGGGGGGASKGRSPAKSAAPKAGKPAGARRRRPAGGNRTRSAA